MGSFVFTEAEPGFIAFAYIGWQPPRCLDLKAVLLRQPGRSGGVGAEVADVPVPEIAPGELLVEMMACGLCGTDVEKIRGEYTASLPILGHEAVGVVAQVGEGALDFRKGDRVFPHHHVPCHQCYYCLHGDETLCKEYRRSNIHPGGFSEYFRVPAWNVGKGGVLRLPQGIGFAEASLIEPAACCVRALDKCSVGESDVALVVGAGPVGVLHAILLGQRGARVMVSDVSEGRLRLAERLGIENLVDAKAVDVSEGVRKLSEGRGADIAIVAAGSPQAVKQAAGAVRPGGKVCMFGVPPKGSMMDIDASELYNSGLTIVTSYGATEKDVTSALDAIGRSRDRFSQVVTHSFPIARFDEAMGVATSGSGLKVVITP